MPFIYKRVLIIGATSGIGIALAEKMIANGSHVIAVGRRKDRLDSLVEKYGTEKVSALQFDITNLGGIPSFVKTVVASHPDLDSVLLSSGIQRPLDFSSPESIDLDLVSTELTTNYISYIHILKYLLPYFLSSSSPASPKSLIFISSALGLVPIPKVAGYCASKAALHHLVLCIREQVGGKGVKVIEIVPPAVRTELHDYDGKEEKGSGGGGKGVGMDLEAFTEEVWKSLEEGKDDIAVGMAAKAYEVFEEKRQGMFRMLMDLMKGSGEK